MIRASMAIAAVATMVLFALGGGLFEGVLLVGLVGAWMAMAFRKATATSTHVSAISGAKHHFPSAQ